MGQAVRNVHLPLPEPLYRRLRAAAEHTNQPATTLARHALDSWLRQRRKQLRREAVATHAAEVAGSQDDYDEALESASLERLDAGLGAALDLGWCAASAPT